jgi:cobalamin biosynthesis Mg chelatase CobN
LTAESQAIQSKLDVVTSHNQKLVEENQQLRQEIRKIIQSCLDLQKLVDAPAPSSPAVPHHEDVQHQPQPIPSSQNEVRYTNNPLTTSAPPRQQTQRLRKVKVKKAAFAPRHQKSAAPVKDMNFPVTETVFIEEQQVRCSRSPQSESKGLNSWWLIITIILIMVTGFAAGYLIVRPLFQNQIQK